MLVILLFELPMLTRCQTTSVFYQNLNGCKAKNRYFDADFADFTERMTGDERPETTENRAKGPASFEA